MERVAKGLILSVLLLAGACADDDNDGRVLDDRGPGSRVDQVENALVSPSGTVDQTSARTVEGHAAAFADARAAFDAVLFVRAAGASACRQGSDEDATYDLDCASAGKLSGSLMVHADAVLNADVASTLVTVELRDACALGTCVNATGEMRLLAANGALSATVALEASVTGNDGTVGLSVGAKGMIGNGALDAEIVYFDDVGHTLVVEAGLGIEGLGAYKVRGANGTYDCAVLLDQRTCTGAGGQGAITL